MPVAQLPCLDVPRSKKITEWITTVDCKEALMRSPPQQKKKIAEWITTMDCSEALSVQQPFTRLASWATGGQRQDTGRAAGHHAPPEKHSWSSVAAADPGSPLKTDALIAQTLAHF
uniref:Uncharacterized protein n=1 Tax=Calcidiscus leptoporus TaxID=127549 RepID=A0A7S0JG71_9EUKA|mmetsp:Transcript_55191/g.126904  ORF Transcript_55191/g.126904 Transcript_55191/m.126904 type:complete len:116 (+) Transcript_55191:40-387(+)